MMRHTIVKVGEMRSGPLREVCSQYCKRLRPYVRVEFVSTAAERIPPDPSAAETKKVVQAEGERLIRAAPQGPQCKWVALDEHGRHMDSPTLADYLQDQATYGLSHVVWFVGGPLGLSNDLIGRASLRFSLSSLTFPHQMVPVILLEQIYRSCRIQRGEPYHY